MQRIFGSHLPLDLSIPTSNSAQQLWDNIKKEIANYSKSFQLDHKSWLKKSIKKLLSKCNQILRNYKHTTILSTLLPSLKALLGQLQDEHAQIEILKAGKLWRKNGKRSPKLFKRLSSSRESQRNTRHL